MKVREARGREVHAPHAGDARGGDEFACEEVPRHVRGQLLAAHETRDRVRESEIETGRSGI
jgi:hypothetical protein